MKISTEMGTRREMEMATETDKVCGNGRGNGHGASAGHRSLHGRGHHTRESTKTRPKSHAPERRTAPVSAPCPCGRDTIPVTERCVHCNGAAREPQFPDLSMLSQAELAREAAITPSLLTKMLDRRRG